MKVFVYNKKDNKAYSVFNSVIQVYYRIQKGSKYLVISGIEEYCEIDLKAYKVVIYAN